MDRLLNLYRWGRGRIIPILATIPLVGLGIFGGLEYANIVNFIQIQWPLDSSEFGQIAGALLSVILSYALVILYWQQKKVQESQQDLLQQQYEPYLSGEVATLHIVSAQFKIRNTGSAPAYNVKAEWEIAGQTREWEIPTLVPGESFGFPILVDENDNWLLNTDRVSDYLEQANSDGEIDYKITGENPHNERRKFTGTVDFSVLSMRSDANEIWETEPLEEIANEIGKMRKDIRKISRYTEKEKREVGWRVRTAQVDLVLEYIDNFGPLDIDELRGLTGISEHDLTRKLERLDQLGEIDYNEATGAIKQGPSSGPNKNLDDDYR